MLLNFKIILFLHQRFSTVVISYRLLWFRKCHSFLFGREVSLIYAFDISGFIEKSLSASKKKSVHLFDWSKMIFLESLLISAVLTDDLRSHWLEEELVEGKIKMIFFDLWWPKLTWKVHFSILFPNLWPTVTLIIFYFENLTRTFCVIIDYFLLRSNFYLFPPCSAIYDLELP